MKKSDAEKPAGTESTHFTRTRPGNNTLGASTFIEMKMDLLERK